MKREKRKKFVKTSKSTYFIPRGFGCSFSNSVLETIGPLWIGLWVQGVIALGGVASSDFVPPDDVFPFGSGSFGGGFLVEDVVLSGDGFTSR